LEITEIEDSVVYKLSDTIANIHPFAPPLVMSSGVPRSGGLHLTQITSDLFGYSREEGSTEGNERMAVGFAFEHLLSWAIGQVFHQEPESGGVMIHPGEWEKDGIKMSPDALWVYEDVLEEWKATYKSSLKPLEENTTWLWQNKAYCHALGMKKARFRVLHLNGAYRRGTGRCANGPCIKTWFVEYSEAELESNWSMVVQHARSKGWLPQEET
jgi:hypothetical protein